MDTKREHYMRIALLLAEEASAAGEVPVGCVVCNASGEVIGRGRNRCMEKHDATAHAEMEAIREASAAVGDWRLEGCTLYVTLEPCPMCAGAIMNSRIRQVVFGARDAVKGACGSVIDLFYENFPDKAAVFGGVLAEESAEKLSTFFDSVRK
jgi:tRNA(adenine34) deaminase